MSVIRMKCPFCDESNALTKGQCLVIPKCHVSSIRDLSDAEIESER